MKTTQVKGYNVMYEDNAYEGVIYLRDSLDFSEAEVFFRTARTRASVPFEDHSNRDYTLAYNNGTYVVVRR
mgnify:FL=1